MSTELHINLSAITRNYKILSHTAKNAETAAVMKANAYGLGIDRITPALVKSGLHTAFVAHPEEAYTLRNLSKDLTIYALNGPVRANPKDMIDHRIIPVLNSLHDITYWQEEARKRTKKLPCALHFDTGMNRLGLGTTETAILIEQQSMLDNGLDIKLIMSHFSCADDENHEETYKQIVKFNKIRTYFPLIPASLCNSAGIFSAPDSHYHLVRPGMALYGLNPTPYQANPMQAVISLRTPILNIQSVPAGEHVGYGASYTTSSHEKLATLCLGYADGFLRSLSGRGHLYWNGIACPIRGRVSMDLVTVSIQHIQGTPPQPGDLMDVIGPAQDADRLAEQAGTIGYEILTSLSTRYKRIYHS